jgi:hypothetical protein
MGARGALLDPADVEIGITEIHLIPPQVHEFGCPQAMPVSHKDRGGVPVAPTVFLGRVDQPLDLGLGQVLTGPQGPIRWPLGPDCSVYGCWHD